MTRRIHSDVVAIGLSVVGLASGFWLLGKAAIEFVSAAIDRSVQLPEGKK